MSIKKSAPLPWKIEAFREYLTFETLKSAASVLKIFEGESFDVKNPRIQEMQSLLELRTKKHAWLPNRTGSEDINWNLEGSVYRNKGRVFTSMLILYPREWVNNTIKLTEFGNALSSGAVDKVQFYDYIIENFKYPHPAYEKDWDAWVNAKIEIHPFILILEVLVELYLSSPNDAFINSTEVAEIIHKAPNHNNTKQYASDILNNRNTHHKYCSERTDDIHRKITDILGFLCLTKYCYSLGDKTHLNLLAIHTENKAHFWESYKSQDKLEDIKDLISRSKK